MKVRYRKGCSLLWRVVTWSVEVSGIMPFFIGVTTSLSVPRMKWTGRTNVVSGSFHWVTASLSASGGTAFHCSQCCRIEVFFQSLKYWAFWANKYSVKFVASGWDSRDWMNSSINCSSFSPVLIFCIMSSLRSSSQRWKNSLRLSPWILSNL